MRKKQKKQLLRNYTKKCNFLISRYKITPDVLTGH